MTDLFFELFTGLPRQGPGDEASTLRALGHIPPLGPDGRVLDVGCGTGAQSLVLARHTRARIVAIDSHAPFVAELRRDTRALGLSPRLQACVGDMAALALAEQVREEIDVWRRYSDYYAYVFYVMRRIG